MAKVILFLLTVLLLAATLRGAMATDLACNMYQVSCNPTETKILGFYNMSYNFSNSHVQLANYTNYPSVLCCNSSKYQIGNSSGEVFLRLSSPTNAHVQNNSVYPTVYNYPAYISQNESKPLCKTLSSCPAIYTCLLSLSNVTNAHLGGCSDPYQYQICCKTRDLVTLNITTNASSGVFPINFNIAASSTNTGDSDITYTFWKNNQLISTPDIFTPAVGNYTYIYNITLDGENYTYAQVNLSFSISQFNTSSILYMTNIINFTGTYPVNSSTQGFGCPSQLTCTLFYDGITAPNPYYNLIGTGNHTFTYSTPGNENYTSASLTWYVGNINTSSTTVVTVTGSSGGSWPSPYQNCVYFFDKPVYYSGDKAYLNFSCPYQGLQFIANFNNSKSILYLTSGIIQPANQISFKPTEPGDILILVQNLILFSAKVPYQSTLTRNLGYLYMILIGLGIFGIMYLVSMLTRYERTGTIKKADYVVGALALLSLIFGGWLYINQGGGIGTIYMILLGLAILIIIYYLNLFLKYEQSKDPDKKLLPSIREKVITILVGLGVLIGAGVYLFSSGNVGYVYMVLIGIAIFISLFILNKLMTNKRGDEYGNR